MRNQTQLEFWIRHELRIDWSETAISSPLLDLGRFLEFLNRKHLNSHPALEIQIELIETFFAPWQNLVSRETFLNAAKVAPLVATLVFAARAWQRETPKVPFMVAYHLRRAVYLTRQHFLQRHSE